MNTYQVMRSEQQLLLFIPHILLIRNSHIRPTVNAIRCFFFFDITAKSVLLIAIVVIHFIAKETTTSACFPKLHVCIIHVIFRFLGH